MSQIFPVSWQWKGKYIPFCRLLLRPCLMLSHSKSHQATRPHVLSYTLGTCDKPIFGFAWSFTRPRIAGWVSRRYVTATNLNEGHWHTQTHTCSHSLLWGTADTNYWPVVRDNQSDWQAAPGTLQDICWVGSQRNIRDFPMGVGHSWHAHNHCDLWLCRGRLLNKTS